MRVTSKGRVTIPHAIRERLGLLPQTEVEFTVERGVVVLRPKLAASTRAQRIVAHLKASGSKMRMSSKDLMALLRDEPSEIEGH